MAAGCDAARWLFGSPCVKSGVYELSLELMKASTVTIGSISLVSRVANYPSMSHALGRISLQLMDFEQVATDGLTEGDTSSCTQ